MWFLDCKVCPLVSSEASWMGGRPAPSSVNLANQESRLERRGVPMIVISSFDLGQPGVTPA
jgi:hypothetical protein